jgi:hypothetical protein
MHSPLEITMRIAILRYPETFGLKEEEVNPLLQYTFVTAEIEGSDIDYDDILSRCIHTCEMTIADKITEILKGKGRESVGEMLLSNHIKKALLKAGKNPADSNGKNPADNNGNGKNPAESNGNGNSQDEKGYKVTPKQVRYLGYLQHQLGEKPDYKEIGKLTQKQATLRIKDLEKEVNKKA